MAHPDSFGARSTLRVGDASTRSSGSTRCSRATTSPGCRTRCAILLENVLRHEDGATVTTDDVEAVATLGREGASRRARSRSRPARVLLQDFTGVPGDRRPRRDARRDGRPRRRPEQDQPADPRRARDRPLGAGRRRSPAASRSAATPSSSSSATASATPSCAGARAHSTASRSSRRTRASCHQVNLEFLGARGRGAQRAGLPRHARRHRLAHDDDQRPRRARLGRRRDRGRGGDARRGDLDARPAGRRLPAPRAAAGGRDGDRPRPHRDADPARRRASSGSSSSTSATGLDGLPLADRATIGNMSPEYGATCGFFPVDDETLRYLRLTGRATERVALVEAYCKENVLWHDPDDEPTYSQVVELDLADRRAVARRAAAAAGPRAAPRREAVVPRGAGDLRRRLRQQPRRGGRGVVPRQRPARTRRPGRTRRPRADAVRWRPRRSRRAARRGVECELDGETVALDHGSVVIAAITSCTNTSNPSVMVGAGLLAKKAVERGLERRAVGQVEPRARLEGRHRVLRQGRPDAVPRGARLPHRRLRLHDLHRELRAAARAGLAAIAEGDLVACAVLSGNRNFEARIHPEVKANYLASPPLVVAYALAGRMDLDLDDASRSARTRRRGRLPLGHLAVARGGAGDDRRRDRRARCSGAPTPTSTRATPPGASCPCRRASCSPGSPRSTYVRQPPYFDGMAREPGRSTDIAGARCLVSLGDSVTTDHISPAGVDQAGLARGAVPRRARRRARRLQLLRLAARQPRGDGARHVRQRPPPQPARPRARRARGRCTSRPARR